jgi:hypothetical protein
MVFFKGISCISVAFITYDHYNDPFIGLPMMIISLLGVIKILEEGFGR